MHNSCCDIFEKEEISVNKRSKTGIMQVWALYSAIGMFFISWGAGMLYPALEKLLGESPLRNLMISIIIIAIGFCFLFGGLRWTARKLKSYEKSKMQSNKLTPKNHHGRIRQSH
jgi:hypothetical protein